MEMLTNVWDFLFLVFIVPLLYFFGFCFVYFYFSLPVIFLINYFYFKFLRKRNKFSIKKQIVFNLFWIFSIPAFSFVVGWGFPIRLVVPDGYVGKIEIIEDKSQGQAIPVVRLSYQVVIPPSGVLRVKSIRPWMRIHTENPIYTSGKPIPVEFTSSASPDRPVLYGGGCGNVKMWNGKKVDITYIDYTLGAENDTEPDMKKLIN